jgi:hypothetical protein
MSILRNKVGTGGAAALDMAQVGLFNQAGMRV